MIHLEHPLKTLVFISFEGVQDGKFILNTSWTKREKPCLYWISSWTGDWIHMDEQILKTIRIYFGDLNGITTERFYNCYRKMCEEDTVRIREKSVVIREACEICGVKIKREYYKVFGRWLNEGQNLFIRNQETWFENRE